MDRYKLELTESEIKNEMSYKDTKVLKYSIKYPQFTVSAGAFKDANGNLNAE